jgi:hypothetical protein
MWRPDPHGARWVSEKSLGQKIRPTLLTMFTFFPLYYNKVTQGMKYTSKNLKPATRYFHIKFELSYETIWIFTRGFVCQYLVIQQKNIDFLGGNSLSHDDFVLKRKIVLVLWNNEIFFLLFIVWFLWMSLTQKITKRLKTCRDCSQRSAEEQVELVCYRLAAGWVLEIFYASIDN